MIDKKALGIFLGITYGVSWFVALVLYFAGYAPGDSMGVSDSVLQLGMMLLPAIAAFLAAALTRDRAHPRIILWPLDNRLVLAFALIAPACFIFVYGLSVALGYGAMDWSVAYLQSQLPAPQEVGLQQQLPAFFLLIAGFLLSIVLGPTLFALVSLGTEIGWRAYLAQKFAPLGRWRASALSAGLWGLGWFPLMLGSTWAGNASFLEALWAALRVTVAIFLFGMILAEVFRRTQHAGMVAICAGCFYAQLLGIWDYLIRQQVSGVTGPFGLIGLLCLALLVPAVFFSPGWGYRLPEAARQTPEAGSEE